MEAKAYKKELVALISANLLNILKEKGAGAEKKLEKMIKANAKKLSKKLIKKIKKANKFIQKSHVSDIAQAAKGMIPGVG